MSLTALTMPKWGLAMIEGTIASWTVSLDDKIVKGDEILEIETSKITNMVESPMSGYIKAITAQERETLPVGALLAVISDTPDPDPLAVEEFIAEFNRSFVPPERKESEQEAQPERIDISGKYTLQYLKAGSSEGIPIVMIHGFSSSHTVWTLNQAQLSEDYTVYALDLPGHGGSSKEIESVDGDTLTEWISDFLDGLEISKVHLVGHSLGGLMSLSYALKYPERCASVTAISPAGLGREINTDFLDGFINARRKKEMSEALRKLVANPSVITAEMNDQILKYKRLDGVEKALRAIRDVLVVDGVQRFSLQERLKDLACPTQVIWGQEDQVLPISQVANLPRTVQVITLPDAGHLPHMEKAKEVTQKISDLIAGLSH